MVVVVEVKMLLLAATPQGERREKMVEESCYCEFLLIHLPYANTRLPHAPNTKGTASCQWILFFFMPGWAFLPSSYFLLFPCFSKGASLSSPNHRIPPLARKGTKKKMYPGKAQIVIHLQSQNTLFQYDYFNPCVKSCSGNNNKGHGL